MLDKKAVMTKKKSKNLLDKKAYVIVIKITAFLNSY